jgi:spermidine/putrescine transport system substrate-binding protein
MKRRRFDLLLILGLIFLLALLVTACDSSADEAEEPTPTAETKETAEETKETTEETAMSDRCGDRSQLSDQLNFFNWADYMDEEILNQFEEECGVKVVMDLYTSNEEAIAKIQAGNSGYDLVIPTDYALGIMANEGLLMELNMEDIPNAENLNPQNLGMYYDPENKYSLPYQWSTTGLAYNADAFPDGPPDSWAVMFDPEQLCEHKGFVSMLDDPREATAMAFIYLGYSPNETDPAAHEEVKELMLEQKECLASYNSENFIQTLAAEEVVMAEAWGFAAALARAENENIHYVIPQEGGDIWQDNMAVPVDAPHPYTAHVFINYLLEPDIGAQLTEWTFGFTPNLAAEELLSDDYYTLMREGGMLPDDETIERLHWLTRGEGFEIFDDTWTAIKAE